MTDTIKTTSSDAIRRVTHKTVATQPETAYFAVMSSPVGRLRVTLSNRGVAAVDFSTSDGDAYLLGQQLGLDLAESQERLAPVFAALEAYFAGEARAFDLPLDLSLVRNSFARAVLARLIDVGYGQTITYGELATACGAPRAARAVGTVCARNPLPILIPCHRVVPTNGIGNYGGGVAAKQWLLELEGAEVVAAMAPAA